MRDINGMTSYELQTLCKTSEPKLSTMGTKSDLVVRLVDHSQARLRETRVAGAHRQTFNSVSDPTGDTRTMVINKAYEEDTMLEKMRNAAILATLKIQVQIEETRHAKSMIALQKANNEQLLMINKSVREMAKGTQAKAATDQRTDGEVMNVGEDNDLKMVKDGERRRKLNTATKKRKDKAQKVIHEPYYMESGQAMSVGGKEATAAENRGNGTSPLRVCRVDLHYFLVSESFRSFTKVNSEITSTQPFEEDLPIIPSS